MVLADEQIVGSGETISSKVMHSLQPHCVTSAHISHFALMSSCQRLAIFAGIFSTTRHLCEINHIHVHIYPSHLVPLILFIQTTKYLLCDIYSFTQNLCHTFMG